MSHRDRLGRAWRCLCSAQRGRKATVFSPFEDVSFGRLKLGALGRENNHNFGIGCTSSFSSTKVLAVQNFSFLSETIRIRNEGESKNSFNDFLLAFSLSPSLEFLSFFLLLLLVATEP